MFNPYSLKSGDLILFANKSWSLKDKVLNCPTRWLTWDKWTHCGVIFSPEIPKDSKLTLPLLFESQKSDSLLDVHYLEYISGVQCVNFLKRLFEYKGEVYLRKFIGKIDNQLLNEKILEYSCKPFCRNPYRLLKGISWMNWLPTWFKGDSWFCSELLIKIYQDLGVLSDKIHPGNYSPIDFAYDGRLQYHLNEGYGFGPLQLLRSSDDVEYY
jgi:hypothetical protein